MLTQTLDVRDNKLRSLDTLTEGLTRLHELYVSDNQLTSLVGLPAKAPALETLVGDTHTHTDTHAIHAHTSRTHN